MKKKIIIIIICIFVLLIVNKLFLYNNYLVPQDINIENIGEIDLKHKDAKDYLNYNGIKIRNDFKKYVFEEDEGSYVLYNKDEDIINTFSVYEVNTLLQIFKEYDNDILNEKYIERFLKDNNINNDIELLEYLSNYKNNINYFSSNKEIKFNFYVYQFVYDVLPLIDEYKIIKGDYTGILLFHDNYEEEKSIDIMLLNDGMRYVLSFNGFDINENNILDVVGTVIFNEEEQ